MNLENLRCLLHVAEAGSFSQAARDSYLSQQAISDQIRRLEQHYQTPLLERTRPVRLTQAGAVVCDTAREVLAAMGPLRTTGGAAARAGLPPGDFHRPGVDAALSAGGDRPVSASGAPC